MYVLYVCVSYIYLLIVSTSVKNIQYVMCGVCTEAHGKGNK